MKQKNMEHCHNRMTDLLKSATGEVRPSRFISASELGACFITWHAAVDLAILFPESFLFRLTAACSRYFSHLPLDLLQGSSTLLFSSISLSPDEFPSNDHPLSYTQQVSQRFLAAASGCFCSNRSNTLQHKPDLCIRLRQNADRHSEWCYSIFEYAAV